MGRRVRVRRELLQVSVDALANMTGIPANLISSYESGRAMMPAAVVYSMTKALKVDLDFFWAAAPQVPPTPDRSVPAKLQLVKG
jgi:transcriptional regulator with XRE-family HTH domain